MAAEYVSLVKPAIDLIVALAKKETGEDDNIEIVADPKKMEDAFAARIDMAAGWSTEYVLKGMDSGKDLADQYVTQHCRPGETWKGYESSGNVRVDETEAISTLLSAKNNVLLLGDLGAGKTTLLKKILHVLHTSNKYDYINYAIPVLFRDINRTELSLYDTLAEYIGVSVEARGKKRNTKATQERRSEILRRVLVDYFDASGGLLLLDGYDEIDNHNLAVEVVNEVHSLSLSFKAAKFILTSRTSSWDRNLSSTSVYSLCQFSDKEVREYAKKYLSDVRGRNVNTFLQKLKKKPYAELRHSPLHLSYFCIAFETTGAFPANNVLVYDEVVDLRIREWDKQRGASHTSRFPKLKGPGNLKRFLCHLAYELACGGSAAKFTRHALENALASMGDRYDLHTEHTQDVAKDLETATGLINIEADKSYSFTHKSIYEYMCADHLSRTQLANSSTKSLMRMPDSFALAIPLTGNPEEFFAIGAIRLRRAEEDGSVAHEAMVSFWLRVMDRLSMEGVQMKSEPAFYLALLLINTWLVNWEHRQEVVVRKDTRSNKLRRMLVKLCARETVAYGIKSFIGKNYQKGTPSNIVVRGAAHVITQMDRRIVSPEIGHLPRMLVIDPDIWNAVYGEAE